MENRKVLWEEVNSITSKFSSKDLVEKMNSVGIPCGPINNIGEAFNDHHVKSLKMTKKVTHPELGELSLLRSPITLSSVGQESGFERAGRELGADSQEILKELNYSDDAIEKLKKDGIVKIL